MLSFSTFLLESNTDLGQAYEAGVAHYLHMNSGSLYNKDPEHLARMRAAESTYNRLLDTFPEKKKKEIRDAVRKSGETYLNSLASNHGISPTDISEVHHTYAGIDHILGKAVDRASNPHDVVIKTYDGRMHGASLKFKPGTLANTSVNSMDALNANSGMKTDIAGIWQAAKKEAGLEGMSNDQIKKVRDEPKIKEANAKAKLAAAQHHADVFNKASVEQQRTYLQNITKSNPDLPYDYVVGSKGTAQPIEQKKQNIQITNAKGFTAHVRAGGQVYIHDHEGNQLVYFEHRPTHGSFVSPQVNAKFGTGKPSNMSS